jgi:hypothetical protein
MIQEVNIMTWKEIKKAVEEAGVNEEEEIFLIQCEIGEGDKTFHKMRLGTTLKLAENAAADAEEYSGCAV